MDLRIQGMLRSADLFIPDLGGFMLKNMRKIYGLLFLGLLLQGGCVNAVPDVEAIVGGEVPQKIVESDMKKLVIAGLDCAEKTLSNGMRIVALKQPSAQNVCVELVFPGVGAIIEDDANKGVAHLIEHLFFKGTPKLDEGAYWKIISRYGGQTNAFTAFDLTAYFVTLPANNWKPILTMFADVMQNASFDDQHLASEVKVVIKEMRKNADCSKRLIFDNFFRLSFTQDHPQYPCVIGYKKDLAGVTAESIKKGFFDKYYHPDAATLFMVGNLDLDDAISTAENAFVHISSGNVVLPNPYEKTYELKKGGHSIVHQENAVPQSVVGWHMPAGICEDAFAAEMLGEVLTGGDTGVLTQRLVHDEKCAKSVGIEIELAKGNSSFILKVTPLEGQLERCIECVHDELAKIVEHGVSQDVLNRILNCVRVSHARSFENTSSSVMGIDIGWLMKFAQRQRLDDCFEPVEALSLVTSEQIQKFVATYLKPADMNRVDLLPLLEEDREAQKLALEEDQRLEAEILAAHQRTRPVVDSVIPAEYPAANPIQCVFPKPDIRVVFENGLTVVAAQEKASDLSVFKLTHKDQERFLSSIDDIVLGVVGEMLLHGTDTESRFDIAKWFEDRGIDVSVTSACASIVSLKKDFSAAVTKLFDVILHACFDASDLESIKTRVVCSLEMLKQDGPNIARRLSTQKLYPGSVRDWSFDDAIAKVKSLSIDDIRLYATRFFDPENMIVSVVGKFEPQELVAIVSRATENWKSTHQSAYEPLKLEKPCVDGADLLLLRDQVVIEYSRRSPYTMLDKEYPTFAVLSELFDKKMWDLREETGLFYIVKGIFARGGNHVPGFDWAYVQTGPELVDQTCDKIKTCLTAGLLSDIDAGKLEEAKMMVLSNLQKSFSTVAGRAAWFASSERNQLPEGFYENYVQTVQALTPESALEHMKKYLSSGDFICVRVGNLKK